MIQRVCRDANGARCGIEVTVCGAEMEGLLDRDRGRRRRGAARQIGSDQRPMMSRRRLSQRQQTQRHRVSPVDGSVDPLAC
jgi:hypothetical protein